MAASSISPLTQSARRHARRIQIVVASIGVAFVPLSQLSLPALNDLEVWLGTWPLTVLILMPFAVAISFFTSWSAIWIVLGTGRWLRRVLFSFAVFHLAVAVGLAIAVAWEYGRNGRLADSWGRELFAMIAGASYAFAICLACSMFCVWFMKLRRYRLLYFDTAKDYPRPRKLAREIPIDERAETAVLSGRVHLADMFALTTLFAIYLGTWYPIVHVALVDIQIFGPGFMFTVVLISLLISGAAGLAMILLPLVMGILDHRGIFFQGVGNAIVLAIVCLCAVAGTIYQEFDLETVVTSVTSVTTLILYQTMLFLVLRKPSRSFRFRLVRRQM